MDSTNNVCMAVDTEMLVKVFLKLLNNEELINNKTYLAAKNEIEKGENDNVNLQ